MGKKIILIIAFILLCSCIYAEKAYVVQLGSTEDFLVFNSLNMGEREVKEFPPGTNYLAEVIDFNGNVIFKTPFEPPAYGPFALTLPYQENAKEIRIRDQYSVIMSIKVGQYAEVCGNKVCNRDETKESCPEDCDFQRTLNVPNDTEEIEDIKINKTKNEDKNQTEEKTPFDENPTVVKKKKSSSSGILVFVIIFIGTLVGLMFLFIGIVKFKSRAKKDEMTQNLTENNRETKGTETAQTNTNARESLKNYLTQCKSQGYSEEQMKQYLISQNYDSAVVNDAMKDVYVK
jgi:hypothetical protein